MDYEVEAKMKGMIEIQKKLSEHKNFLEDNYNVKYIGIFGSFARGEQKKASDVDVLVEFKKPIGLFRFLELEEYLHKKLGVKVDLVSKKALKPHMGKRILKEVVAV